MPIKIPRYNESQVEHQGVGTPHAEGYGPAAFGGGLAQGLQAVSEDMFQLAAEKQKNINKIVALNARTAVNAAEYDLDNGDEKQPGFGLMKKKGLAAVQDEPIALENFKKRLGQIRGSLTNDDQRLAFDAIAADRLSFIQNHIAENSRKEMDWHNAESLKATIESSLTRVGTHHKEPNEVARELDIIKYSVDNQLTQQGLGTTDADKVIRNRYMKDAEDKVHALVLEKYLDEDDYVSALQYVEKHPDSFADTKGVKDRIEADKKGAEAELLRAQKEQQTLLREEANKQLTDLRLQGRLKRSDVVKQRAILGENEYNQWFDRIESYEKAAKKAAEGDGDFKTNKGLDAKLFQTIVSDPESISDTEISEYIGKGLSRSAASTLIEKRHSFLNGTIDPGSAAGQKAVMDALKRDRAAKVFGEGQEGDIEHAKTIETFRRWVKANPKEDPSEFYETLMKPVKDSWVAKQLDKAISFTGYETTGGMRKPTPEEMKQRREGMAGSTKIGYSKWLAAAKKSNPKATEQELKAYYTKKYGNR